MRQALCFPMHPHGASSPTSLRCFWQSSAIRPLLEYQPAEKGGLEWDLVSVLAGKEYPSGNSPPGARSMHLRNRRLHFIKQLGPQFGYRFPETGGALDHLGIHDEIVYLVEIVGFYFRHLSGHYAHAASGNFFCSRTLRAAFPFFIASDMVAN
jgi:hypothetical protein